MNSVGGPSPSSSAARKSTPLSLQQTVLFLLLSKFLLLPVQLHALVVHLSLVVQPLLRVALKLGVTCSREFISKPAIQMQQGTTHACNAKEVENMLADT